MTNQETLELALNALKCLFGLPDKFTGEGGDVAVWRLGGSYRAQEAIKALEEALAKQEQPIERNFCERCGKRAFDGIHTCTPPVKQEKGEPVAWMYDWTSDEGEFIQDWTTSMAETLRDTGKTVITNVRPLYLAPQVIHKPLQHFGEIPMAWCRWSEHLGKWMYTHRQPTEELAWIPLYDHPPQQRKPLTFEQVEDCFCEGATAEENGILVSAQWLHDFARAIEAAHGIKE